MTGVLLNLPAGAWSDIFGRRVLLIVGTVVFATMPFTYLGVASLGGLIAVRFVHGAATAVFGPVAAASVSDVAPAARRATWLSTYSTIQGVGQALGPIVSGYLIARSRYDLAFVAAGGLAAATPFLAAGWPTTHIPARASVPAARLSQFTAGILDVAREPLILMTSFAQAAQFVLNGRTLNAFLPLFAADELGLRASDLGWLFALQTGTTLATRPILGVVSDRTGRRGVIVAGLMLCSGTVVLVSTASGLPALIGAVVVYAAGVAVTTSATSAFITDLSKRARYGTAHGVFGTIYDVGDALGPILAGMLVATFGYRPMFRVMAGLALTVATAFSIVARRALRQLRERPGA